jgi:hypothetical protein
MSAKDYRELAREVINKEKWWDLLSRFIDVLRINIFVVDNQGLIVLPPEEGRYGGRLLTDRSLKFDLVDDSIHIEAQFERNGYFLEAYNRFDLHSFAIPINMDDRIIAYMVVGPVILNKRLPGPDYEAMAEEFGCDKGDLLSELGGIRVLSNVMINSILDLLSEIVRDNIELSLRKRELSEIKSDMGGGASKEFTEKANEIYSTVYFDELLVTLLDVALKITRAECGSIMVKDALRNELTVKVSRGLDAEKARNATIKLGEGIAGIAAQTNESFIIRGIEGDNRIKAFLKRPEIKEALVMPLSERENVFGVLSLHTKSDGGKIDANLENLQYLSKLMSSVFLPE